MKKFTQKSSLPLLLILIIAGQLLFLFVSSKFTTPRYEGQIFATIGVQHETEDLHKLNEAAHAFGDTIIGWTKFPHFNSDLLKAAALPEEVSLTAHMQERQNIVFTLHSITPLTQENLIAVKDFTQSKLDQYNHVNQTRFVLSNLDYELAEIRRSYAFGALAALLASTVLWLAVLFVRKEFFAPA